MISAILDYVSKPFSKILKVGNPNHYGAGAHGGQFAPREQLATAAAQLGEHAGRGTVAPASLKRHVATLRATVEATHGRHISNSVFNEHHAIGKARANNPPPAAAAPIQPTTPAAVSLPPTPALAPAPAPVPISSTLAPQHEVDAAVHAMTPEQRQGFLNSSSSIPSTPRHAQMVAAVRAHAAAQTAAPAPTPVPTPSPVPVAIAPVVVPPVSPTVTVGQSLKNLTDIAFNHGAMAKYVQLQNHAGIHQGLVASNKKLQEAKIATRDLGVPIEAVNANASAHMEKGIAAMAAYHAHSPVTNSGMTPHEAAGAARLHYENPHAPAASTAPVPTPVPTPVPAAAPTHAFQTIPAQKFTNINGVHNKFWTVAVHGNHLVKHWGAIGTVGQKQVKEFSSHQAAKNQMSVQIAGKRANGYLSKGPSSISENLPVLHGGVQPLPQGIPVTPHVPAAAQGVNHPSPPAITPPAPVQVIAPTPAPSPLPLAAQSAAVAASTASVSSSDPHGLKALDTPSKMKNAVYDAAHKYHSAVKAGLPSNEHNSKLVAVSNHADSKLGGDTALGMAGKAKQDVQNGIYKLPFKARSRNQSSLPLAAQSGGSQSGGATPASSPLPMVAQAKPAAPAQPVMSEKDKLTADLHKMWHQRGRNVADYAETGINSQAMIDLKDAAGNHEVKLNQLGVHSSYIMAQREVYMNKGKAERKAEIKKEADAKNDLHSSAIALGRSKTFGKGFGESPISDTSMANQEKKLKEHFDKVAALLGHDKATALRESALNNGMKSGTKDLQEDALQALRKASHTYGYALGHNGGFGQQPYSQATHDANKAKMMDIHEKAKHILTPETLKSLITERVEASKNQGLAQHKVEKEAAAKVHREKVTELSKAKGVLSATGENPLVSHAAEHTKHFEALRKIIGDTEALAVNTNAFNEGKAEGQKKLKDDLHKTSFVMGHHAGKGTKPSAMETMKATNAHAMVKQHIGAEQADILSKKAYAEGKQDALDPSMTPAKVHKEMQDLGLHKFVNQDPDFGKHWTKHMPKISPKEFFKGFFGEDSVPTNLSKLDTFKFGSTSLEMHGYGLNMYGSKLERIKRDFNFSDHAKWDCPAHYVEHSFLRVVEADRDKGATGKMFKALMDKGPDGKCLYEKMGMLGAHVHGTLEGGAYVWPSFGFHYDNEGKQEMHQHTIRRELEEASDNVSHDLADFAKVKNYISVKGLKLPNEKGELVTRAFTPEDHQSMLKEHSWITNNLDNTRGDMASGYNLTKLKTPMLNAVFAKVIAENSKIKEPATFVKRLMMGSQHDFYGHISFTNDNPQIVKIRANLNKPKKPKVVS